MNQEAQPGAVIKAPGFWRRHWRLLVAVGVFLLLVLVYVYAALTVLPQWLVTMSAGNADANTQLSAVTTTRSALLGVVGPAVLLFGGVAAFLNYQETVDQRNETRRLRRATVYANFIEGSERCAGAALTVFVTPSDAATYNEHLAKAVEERRAFSAAHDQLMLLGADEVQTAANNLYSHAAVLVKMAMSSPKATAAQWEGVYVNDYATQYSAFLTAARNDLAPTR